MGRGSFRAAHCDGGVGRNFMFFVNSAWVNVTEKSFPWPSSMPACTDDPPWTRNFPYPPPKKYRVHHALKYRQCVWWERLQPTPILRRESTCADQRRRLRNEAPHWAAIPRNSPSIRGRTYGKPRWRHPTHTQGPSVSIRGGYPWKSTQTEREDKPRDQSRRPGGRHS